MTASDGRQNASQAFLWVVADNIQPRVTLDVNKTPSHIDDVGVVNSFIPIPVVVTLTAAVLD